MMQTAQFETSTIVVYLAVGKYCHGRFAVGEATGRTPEARMHSRTGVPVRENSMVQSVLLIELEPAIARVIQQALAETADGEVAVQWVMRLSDGLEQLKKASQTVVLLDLFLPDSQGIDTFVKLSIAVPSVPILILSEL